MNYSLKQKTIKWKIADKWCPQFPFDTYIFYLFSADQWSCPRQDYRMLHYIYAWCSLLVPTSGIWNLAAVCKWMVASEARALRLPCSSSQQCAGVTFYSDSHVLWLTAPNALSSFYLPWRRICLRWLCQRDHFAALGNLDTSVWPWTAMSLMLIVDVCGGACVCVCLYVARLILRTWPHIIPLTCEGE